MYRICKGGSSPASVLKSNQKGNLMEKGDNGFKIALKEKNRLNLENKSSFENKISLLCN